jgi:PAS domain S-box-containing protein
MSWSRHLLALQLVLALGLAAGWLRAAEPAAVSLLMENTSPPFVSVNAQGQPEGYAVELIQAIAADQGLRVKLDLRPWQEVYADFLQGQGDILGLVAYSPERARRMDFSLPLETLVCGLYTQRNRPMPATIADLRGWRIAVIKDALTHEFAGRQHWGADIRPYATLRECLQAVEGGECDALLGMQLVTDQHIRKLGFANIVRSGLAFPEVNYQLCFAVQPGRKELLARLNQGIHTLSLDRRQEELHEKWLGPLEPQQLRWRDLEPWLPAVTLVTMAILGVLLWQRGLLARLSRQAQAIRENEERLQLVFEGSQDAFWDWDAATHRILRSPRWTGMLGYAPEEVGQSWEGFFALVHPDEQPAVLADEKLIRGGKDHFAIEFRMKAKSGEWKWILDRGKVVARDPGTGAPRRVVGTHTDITARKQAEAEAARVRHQMVENQKLESLGVLAGGVAHDFNNLLTVIIGNTSLARLESAGSPANCARLDNVLTASRQAAQLCHSMLAYAGKGSFATQQIDLNQIVTETTRLLELSIAKHVKLEFALAPDLPRNEADPVQIRQVIMNLVTNAAEAMGGKPGTIHLATSVVTLGPDSPGDGSAPTLEAEPGPYVCLEVTDTGEGMDPAMQTRIFEPFYSTKFTGRGLGLPAVLGIVRSHHGTLKVRSTPGRGTIIRVFLPLQQVGTVHPFAEVDAPTGAKT